MIAALGLLGGFTLTAVDHFFSWRMVRCLKEKFGEEGAPTSDIPDCDARWDYKLGHKTTRAMFSDASGPFGSLQRAGVASWSASVALILLLVAMVTEKRRNGLQWTLTVAPIACIALFFGGFVLALDLAEPQTPLAWSRARGLLDAASYALLAAGVLAVVAANQGGTTKQPG